MALDRRRFLGTLAGALALPSMWPPSLASRGVRIRSGIRNGPGAGTRPVPTASQLLWQQYELALFLHFGVNTFTDREWGDGSEDPAVFHPASLDAREWARIARETGFHAMILTAKHHDGFCLWPTATTRHSVASSSWHGGDGDLVREFTDACHAEGLRAGLYLSPWDRNAPCYGDSPRYDDFYCEQLTELLTRYGSVHEVNGWDARSEAASRPLSHYVNPDRRPRPSPSGTLPLHGTLEGRVAWPPEVTLGIVSWIGDGVALGVARDELGVERVVRLRY